MKRNLFQLNLKYDFKVKSDPREQIEKGEDRMVSSGIRIKIEEAVMAPVPLCR